MLPTNIPTPKSVLDGVEAELARLEEECPHAMKVSHAFAPGLYRRACLIPAGTLLTTRVHRTEHFYFVMMGHAKVWNATKPDEVTEIFGGDFGITHPGTRRYIETLDDTIWITVHATKFTAADDIEDVVASLVEPMDNPFLPGYKPNYTLLNGQPLSEKLL